MRASDSRLNDSAHERQHGLVKKRCRPLEMLERLFGDLSAAAGSFEVTGLDEVGLVDVFECAFVFLHGSRKRFHPNRPASKFVDNSQKNLPVHLIESGRINSQPDERILRH